MQTRRLLLFGLVYFFCFVSGSGQNIGIGTVNPHASAAIEIKSSDKGLLLPRLPDNAMRTMTDPAEGLMVYNTSDSSFYVYRSSWRKMSITLPYKNNLSVLPDTAFHIIHQTGVAITGQTNSGFKSGLAGIDNSAAFGTGISGVSVSTYGTGVYGSNNSFGYGVAGFGTGAGATGIYGYSDAGVAGRFVGAPGATALETSGASSLSGPLKLSGINEAPNRILVSDAGGNAFWKELIREEVMMIPSQAFHGKNVKYSETGDIYSDDYGALYAPLILPQGAEITQVQFEVMDNISTYGLQCRLYSFDVSADNNPYLLVDLYSGENFNTGHITLSQNLSLQVQNLTTGYFLRLKAGNNLNGAGDTYWLDYHLKLKGVRVRYKYRLY